MSSEAVIDFVNRSEADPALKARLAGAHGAADVVRVATEEGFDFTVRELEPVVTLLRFLQDVTRDEDLKDALGYAPDAEAVVALAERRGYRFSVADLQRVSLTETSELTEEELEVVAGGAGVLTPRSSGVRVQISASVQRQTPNTNFGTVLQNGLAKSGTAVGSAAPVAAPFIPGGAVISAAVSGLGQT